MPPLIVYILGESNVIEHVSFEVNSVQKALTNFIINNCFKKKQKNKELKKIAYSILKPSKLTLFFLYTDYSRHKYKGWGGARGVRRINHIEKIQNLASKSVFLFHFIIFISKYGDSIFIRHIW